MLFRSYLSIRSISWRTLVSGLPVRDFLKSCSAGRLFLKVLMATSSKLPSISYTSPNICPSKSSESLYHAWTTTAMRSRAEDVTKREPKAWVSCLYKSTESAFRLLNHLIAADPKLDGKTLHISASFLEWIAIIWLNWLTCSTGFVLPL